MICEVILEVIGLPFDCRRYQGIAGVAEWFLHLWDEWGIQFLVLVSFTLQVMLLALAGIRRRKSWAVVRLFLWSMYLLADTTAIYTLGHLYVASNKVDQHLVAFWAPFLLVHLGGPSSITAYSLEDNQLWGRHLFTLLVQVLGAAFITYKYITGSGYITSSSRTSLPLAAALVFIVGVLKYGERTWALWRGNMSSIRSTLKYPKQEREYNISQWISFNPSHWGEELRWPYPSAEDSDFGDEELLLGAHSLLHICKSVFVDATTHLSEFAVICSGWYLGKDAYGLMEMQLSLMYDILYTKAAVIHTWYGYSILVISPLLTTYALLLFHYESSNKNGESKANVAITYALLSGTLVLETMSLVRATCSTWACALLYCCQWEQLLSAVTFFRRHIKAASKRRWSGSMGQYNLLHLCTRDRTELGGKLAAMLGLESWWNKVHYSGTTEISTTDLKDRLLLVFPYIDATNSRGVHALESMGLDRNAAEWKYTHWTLSDYVAFDDSILFWHIATDVYLSKSKVKHEEKLVAAVQLLSNYMMFLLMVQPEMLPGPIRQGQYVDTCDEMDKLWVTYCLAYQNQGDSVRVFLKMWNMIKNLFNGDEPNDSRISQRQLLARTLLSTNVSIATGQWGNPATRIRPPSSRMDLSAYIEGPLLADYLLRRDSDTRLEVIFRVWAEMLCYAAHRCGRDAHARQLNNGGEFITIVWLRIQHQRWILGQG